MLAKCRQVCAVWTIKVKGSDEDEYRVMKILKVKKVWNGCTKHLMKVVIQHIHMLKTEQDETPILKVTFRWMKDKMNVHYTLCNVVNN